MAVSLQASETSIHCKLAIDTTLKTLTLTSTTGSVRDFFLLYYFYVSWKFFDILYIRRSALKIGTLTAGHQWLGVFGGWQRDWSDAPNHGKGLFCGGGRCYLAQSSPTRNRLVSNSIFCDSFRPANISSDYIVILIYFRSCYSDFRGNSQHCDNIDTVPDTPK